MDYQSKQCNSVMKMKIELAGCVDTVYIRGFLGYLEVLQTHSKWVFHYGMDIQRTLKLKSTKRRDATGDYTLFPRPFWPLWFCQQSLVKFSTALTGLIF